MKAITKIIALGIAAAGLIAASVHAGSNTYSTSGYGPQYNSTQVTTPSTTAVTETITLSNGSSNCGGDCEAAGEVYLATLEVSQNGNGTNSGSASNWPADTYQLYETWGGSPQPYGSCSITLSW
jgi:hypothetical protein